MVSVGGEALAGAVMSSSSSNRRARRRQDGCEARRRVTVLAIIVVERDFADPELLVQALTSCGAARCRVVGGLAGAEFRFLTDSAEKVVLEVGKQLAPLAGSAEVIVMAGTSRSHPDVVLHTSGWSEELDISALGTAETWPETGSTEWVVL